MLMNSSGGSAVPLGDIIIMLYAARNDWRMIPSGWFRFFEYSTQRKRVHWAHEKTPHGVP